MSYLLNILHKGVQTDLQSVYVVGQVWAWCSLKDLLKAILAQNRAWGNNIHD